MTTNNRYCHHIEHSIHYDVNGRTAPCCQFRGDNDPFYVEPDEYFQSDWLTKIKGQMNRGEEISGCQRCYKDESISGESMRTDSNANMTKKLHLGYSNICNKSCNICRPQRSHLVGADYKKVLQQDPDNYFIQEKFKRQKTTAKILQSGNLKLESIVNWVVGDNFKKFKNIIHKVDHIDLDGGEPFMHPELHMLLDMLLKEDYKGSLNITSNGSWTKEYLDKLSRFKKIQIILSIDGVNDLYKLVRPPHSWDWIEERINLIKQYPKIKVKTSTVVHIFNAHQIPEIIRVVQAYGFICNFYPLGQQEYLHTSLCPDSVLEKIINEIKSIDSLTYKKVINYLQGCINRPNTPEQIKMFHAYIDSFGPVKDINYQQYIPWDFGTIK